jgi:hypothetical protein
VRFRSVVVAALGGLAVIGLFRRRRSGFVEVQFDDGSTIRLTRGPEARELLDRASAVLEVLS